MSLLHQELTGQIIGAYYDVYNSLSRGYPEYIYQNAMIGELRERGISCQQQSEYRVFYKHKLVGVQRLDIFVAGEVVVELKCVPKLLKIHKAQAISYLKVVGKAICLLLNFGARQPEFGRLIYSPQPGSPVCFRPSEEQGGSDKQLHYPELTCRIRQALYEVHTDLGSGFIARVYANACHHEFQLSGIPAVPIREMSVFHRNMRVGSVKFAHFCVADKVLVFPAAIENVADLKITNMQNWMAHRKMSLGLIANFKEPALAIKSVIAEEGIGSQDDTNTAWTNPRNPANPCSEA